MSNEENFLARWARRKADAAKIDAVAIEPALPSATEVTSGQAATSGPITTPNQAAGADDAFDLSSLPALDQITAHTDIRPFMNALVPADLRNAALRRIWELDTAIRDYVSPATEYAWNWNEPGNAPGYAPLEAGFKAAEAAARMMSASIEDQTLVESTGQEPGQESAKPSFAPANETRPAASGGAKIQAPAQADHTESAIRLSQKNDQTEEDSSTAAAQPPVVVAAARAPNATLDQFAAHKAQGRHGGATPR